MLESLGNKILRKLEKSGIPVTRGQVLLFGRLRRQNLEVTAGGPRIPSVTDGILWEKKVVRI
jgi:hypothetical protein